MSKPISTLTDSQLWYRSTDCESAVKANPRNPKAMHYLQAMRDCDAELERRRIIRACRAKVRELIDPMTIANPRKRKHYFPRPWIRQEVFDAAHRLAFLKVCKPA